MKNLLQTIRATFLLILLIGSAQTAEAYDFVYGGIYYNITSSTNMTVAVTYYSKTDNTYSGTITIPEKVTHDGKTYYVTAIGESAFVGCTGLKKVNYSSQKLTTIGNNAFQGCNGMTSLVIPPHITSIGNGVFNGCLGLTGVTIEESEETLSLGYNYYNTSGGKGLFYDCPLTSVFIGRPLSYKTNDDYGYSPFANNKTLVKAHFGNPVKYISDYLFAGCHSLKTLVYNSQCEQNTVGNYAFWDCISLAESDIILPESINTIGDGAFQHCTAINSYTIPNHVTKVGDYAFRYCNNLKNVVIKPSVTSVGNGAFNGCTEMTGVTIEESEETLSLGYNYYNTSGGKGLFYDCPLTSVFIGRPLSYKTSDDYGYSPFANNKKLVKAHFGNPVKYFPSYLFLGCTSLTTLVYNSQFKPTSVGSYSFYGCTSLTWNALNLPQSVTTINEYAFKGCTKFTSVVIKPNITSISNYAFNGCTEMTGVTIEESEETLSLGYNYYNTSGGKGLFYDCPLTSVFIGRPLSYKTSDDYGYSPFANNKTLVKAHFGNPVKYFPSYLFLGCTSLTTLVYNSQFKPTSVGSYSFYGCTSLTWNALNLPQSVTTINEYAFKGCTKFTSVVIKPNITSISNYAFNGCTEMTGVTIEESEETLSLGYNYYNTSGGKGLFYDCPLTSVFIGRPLSYKTSSDYGYSPFANKKTLLKARLGKKLSSIPNYLFYGCTYLNEVTSCATAPPTANANCFANYEARLYVPKNSVTAYRNADVWKSFSYITGVDVGDDDEPIVPGWVVGDVDGNGKVNIDDVTALIQLLLTGHL